jgi:hypothetical protein
MAVTLKVKSGDEGIRAQREAVARRVLECFGDCLPSTKLLCFLDDDDPPDLKRQRGGATNRGFYKPIHDNTPLYDLPDYVASCILNNNSVSFPFPRVVDDLVYLYGSTCANDIGLTMTLAHEIQHAIQHANMREVWAVNGLVPQLHKTLIAALKLQWTDIPIEREARIASKRVAVSLFDRRLVNQYIEEKIAERVTKADAAEWRFVRTLMPSCPSFLVGETKLLFWRLTNYRSELESLLQEEKSANNPDFLDIDLNRYFETA